MFDRPSKIVNDEIFVRVPDFRHQLHLKLESLNPAGSIKLKTACSLIESAIHNNQVDRETVYIESSSGNLGVALAMICAERGLNFTCVIDPYCSAQNEKTIRAYGANVVKVTKTDRNGGYLGSRIDFIKKTLAEDPNHIWLNQYENPANPRAHSIQTASSITRRFDHIDYLFVGAGTTGTLMGCIDHFKRTRPKTKLVAVDSVGSVTFGMPSKTRRIPGLGTSRVPPIFKPTGLHAVELVHEGRAVLMCRHMTKQHGLFIGGSTGTVLAGVYAWRDRISPTDTVIAISPDWGERYLDTVYDDDWARTYFGPSVLKDDLRHMEDFETRTFTPTSASIPSWQNDVPNQANTRHVRTAS